ncbi:MAG TPA: polysaccharide deacetylase family protein [Solirubrobacterales bacterium]|nr:polysaccharide deacetylase family protein [Solirubrobacterales bacterium]
MDAPGTLCISIDNIGEAAELGEGTWDESRPLGEHFTIEVVPRMLDLLDRHGTKATFFVEAFNAELYPDLLGEIAARGHEVGCHAWQHEHWGSLEAEAERELLARSTAALARVVPSPRGFRPPGGRLTALSPELLVDLGYRYYSPAGSRAGIEGDLAVLPFEWPAVDAFYYAPPFADLRKERGLAPEPSTPDALATSFAERLEAATRPGTITTIVFHPMLLADPDRLETFDLILARAADLAATGALDRLRMADLAERLLSSPADHPAPVVDASTWT